MHAVILDEKLGEARTRQQVTNIRSLMAYLLQKFHSYYQAEGHRDVWRGREGCQGWVSSNSLEGNTYTVSKAAALAIVSGHHLATVITVVIIGLTEHRVSHQQLDSPKTRYGTNTRAARS